MSELRVEVAKPLRLEAAAAMEEIDACDAVDCAKRKAVMALDCELKLPGLEDVATLEGIEVVAINLVSTSPMYRYSIQLTGHGRIISCQIKTTRCYRRTRRW